MRALPQALEIIFEIERKRSNEEITKKKKKLSNLEHQLKFYKSSLNSNSNRTTYNDFFWVFGNRLW
jgi:Skp family chaperone for outer membrane proteins